MVQLFTIPSLVGQRNFAFTLENNNLLIKQSHSRSYKKGCFAVRSCTRYVYLIFAVNLAAYMFDGVFCLFSWWCCKASTKGLSCKIYTCFGLVRFKIQPRLEGQISNPTHSDLKSSRVHSTYCFQSKAQN